MRGEMAAAFERAGVVRRVLPIKEVRLNLGIEQTAGGLTVLVVEHQIRRMHRGPNVSKVQRS